MSDSLSAADVRDGVHEAGLDIVAESPFYIVARSTDGSVLVQAVEYPRGWRLQNALEMRRATAGEICHRPEDVVRFCRARLQAGAR